MGSRNLLRSAPSGLYPCAPGGSNDYCFIYTSRAPAKSWQQWTALLRCIGHEELIEDPRFATPELRRDHADVIDTIISEWTEKQTKQTAMSLLGRAGVPAGAVLDTAELIADPDLRERGVFVTVDHPERGEIDLVGRGGEFLGLDHFEIRQVVDQCEQMLAR